MMSTVTQDLNSFFKTPNTGSGWYAVCPSDCSSSHKNINVSNCKLDYYLIDPSGFASFAILDFSSFVSNTANMALLFNAPTQSASNLNIVSNSETGYSSLFSGSTSISLKDSLLISNSYSMLSDGILLITFWSCTFFDCPDTTGTSKRPTTLQRSLVFFDEVKIACFSIGTNPPTKTNPFSEMKPNPYRKAFTHFVIVSD